MSPVTPPLEKVTAAGESSLGELDIGADSMHTGAEAILPRHYLTPDDAQRGVAQDTRRLSATDHTTYLILKFSGGVREARWDLEKILCCSARGSLWDSLQFSERVLWLSFNTCLLRS